MLTHRTDGNGTALLLLNGGLMTIASWDSMVPRLAARHRVVRCDFRGQLLTPGPYTTRLEEHAADVVDLLDHLGIERAHVAGASFGGEVAMVLAATAPLRVDRLTVITATDVTTPAMREDARRLRAIAEDAAAGNGDGGELVRQVAAGTYSDGFLAQLPPDFVERRAQMVAALPREFFAGAASILAPLETLDLTSLLPKITAPTLVIGGGSDRVFPPGHSRAIAAAIPNARLEIIEGTGHGALIERAERVLELMLSPFADLVAS